MVTPTTGNPLIPRGSAHICARRTDGTSAQSGPRRKQFILDTCVLIHDPRAIFHFEDNIVVIPIEAIEELDRLKTEQNSERGFNARQVSRYLDSLFPDPDSMQNGASTPNGGKVVIMVQQNDLALKILKKAGNILRDQGKKDNQILLSALIARATMPPPVVLVSKDTQIRLKAKALGLAAEDYNNDKVDIGSGDDNHSVIEVQDDDLRAFASRGEGVFEGGDLLCNEYVTLRSPSGRTLPARALDSDRVVKLNVPDVINCAGCIPYLPRNDEQRFLMDAMLNPRIPLVVVRGKAGTGKTLAAIVAGLYQVLGPKPRYKRMMISRALMEIGQGVGFLPGSLEEKMTPWLKPYYDALDLLFSGQHVVPPQFAGKKSSSRKEQRKSSGNAAESVNHGYNELVKRGIIQIEALGFIRGRSIPDTLFIVDEVQQLSLSVVKTIVTRMSEDSKLILMGDDQQIDNPLLDSRSNGLTSTYVKLRGDPLVATVFLRKGERSALANLGAEKL